MTNDEFRWMDELTTEELREEAELFEATISSSTKALQAVKKRLENR